LEFNVPFQHKYGYIGDELLLVNLHNNNNNNNNSFMALCPGLPGWAGTRSNTHPPTIL